MAASISASSSQVPSRKEYQVFISFRGSDVRFGFLGHLTTKLREESIDFYVDDRLERGQEISSALIEAIEGSMIALVIFSKDYASSKWCLEELVKIMECKETKQQIVIPVFYDIDPSDVRHQKRTYEEAFTHHEHKFNDNMEKLPIWRSVLKKAADLSGFQAFTHHEQKFNDNMEKLQIWRSVLEKTANLAGYHSLNFRNEPELIDAIVGRVLKILEENSSPRSQPIEFHQNFIRVESLMEVESQEEVRVLGIWGPGGIGKTTLASAIFDKFSSKFESYCFLSVREEYDQRSFDKKLLPELLDEKDCKNISNAKRRLEQKKVLIVLDDVDNSMLLRNSVLGRGSRVIATSRDKHVLISGGIDEKYIHEVEELNFKESLELFSRHAFGKIRPNMGYEELSRRTVDIAKGIPLALEILGSHFHSKNKDYWESELGRLQKCPLQRIQNILKRLVISEQSVEYKI